VVRLLIAALACASFLLAVDAGDHVRKSEPVASATRMVLTADVGTIHVQSGNGKSVDVDVFFHGTPPSPSEFKRMFHDFRLDITTQGSDIRVNGAFHDGWRPMLSFFPFVGFHTMCRNWECLEYASWLREVEYRVTVPQKFNADVDTSAGPISISNLKGEVKAHTSGGSLAFDDVDGLVNGTTSGGGITFEGGKGRAVLRTSGGPIRISEVAGDIDATTSGGGISIERNSGRVKARTSGGGIDIRDASGSVNASTSGGGVTASLLGQPKEECRLSTSGGSINVRLSRDIHVDLDASSSGGSVWTDFPVPPGGDREQRELHAPLNGGGPLLYLHTSGGGITVRHTD
jgi:Putative adhesin